jgi:hypothetical protein
MCHCFCSITPVTEGTAAVRELKLRRKSSCTTESKFAKREHFHTRVDFVCRCRLLVKVMSLDSSMAYTL